MLHIHTERNLLHIPRGTDSARTAAGLLPLLVRPPGTVFRTLSANRTPPKLLQAPAKDILIALSALGVYTGDALYDLHIDNDTLT